MSEDELLGVIDGWKRDISAELPPWVDRDKQAYAQLKQIVEAYFKFEYLKNDPECKDLKVRLLEKYNDGYQQGRFDADMDRELQQEKGVVVDVESLSRKFHEIYMKEARRQGDVRHKDNYDELPENTKEFDRVLARYVLKLLSQAQPKVSRDERAIR
jgi:hypothetical protein